MRTPLYSGHFSLVSKASSSRGPIVLCTNYSYLPHEVDALLRGDAPCLKDGRERWWNMWPWWAGGERELGGEWERGGG